MLIFRFPSSLCFSPCLLKGPLPNAQSSLIGQLTLVWASTTHHVCQLPVSFSSTMIIGTQCDMVMSRCHAIKGGTADEDEMKKMKKVHDKLKTDLKTGFVLHSACKCCKRNRKIPLWTLTSDNHTAPLPPSKTFSPSPQSQQETSCRGEPLQLSTHSVCPSHARCRVSNPCLFRKWDLENILPFLSCCSEGSE